MHNAAILKFIALVGTLGLAACQAGAARDAPDGKVTLYRSAGSKQCAGGGTTPQEVRKELAAAGVAVIEAACGTDGMAHAATCGASDGRIVVIEVKREHARAAQARGLKPLAELPEAARTACR